MKSKYCCFFCPAEDYSLKSVDDVCPQCGRTFGYILSSAPPRIRDYTILRPLGRGFYGAAYIGERTTFRRKRVLKISPKSFYSFFKKASFEDETNQHNTLSQNATHVIDIDDAFEEDIVFGDGTRLSCYVTVLEFVDGVLLRDYIDGAVTASSSRISQIAIDLLRLRAEFVNNRLNHNDLHSENLIVELLPPEARRPNAIDDSMIVKAIDLGSISDASRSSETRAGDFLQIATHVDKLLTVLLSKPEGLYDRDLRTALALQSIVQAMMVRAQNIRQPNSEDWIRQIEEAYYRASHHWKPWTVPFNLKGFGDHYNAQTLESWYVPRLLVDPDDRWLSEISKPGPQIVTGMRGCGKTMLLRALDIHARAARQEGETNQAVIERVANDHFIGLFVSAQRLLDLRHSVYTLEHRLTRLFAMYALQASRALLHIKDLDSSALSPGAHRELGSAIADYLQGADDLRAAVSIDDLESRLEGIAVRVTQGTDVYTVKQAPAQVFAHLSEHLRACSPLLASSSVLFLLDDVSTRYLELERIDELLSALLFQSPICAFKFTSEWQTIELGLQSPGRIHPIRVDRDLAVFDLGADVYRMIKKKRGARFVSDILQQRARFHVLHPGEAIPREILGDVALEQVAREIASSASTSRERKGVYRGLSCLTSVCVGDIGDVIKLYEEILKVALSGGERRAFPVSPEIQSDCFLALSSRRVYDLDRRGGKFKTHALAFADAAHELLLRPYRQWMEEKRRSKEKASGPSNAKGPRLRQYFSIYVRVTSEDQANLHQQIDNLRELVDAGVFVYTGGSARTKTKDSDPLRQFKLSYRKIYGLASFIGLADRDRFELSGADLEMWLAAPSEDVLIRNESKTELDDGEEQSDYESSGSGAQDLNLLKEKQAVVRQETLDFDGESSQRLVWPTFNAKKIDIEIAEIGLTDMKSVKIGTLLTGFGFEDRALESNRVLSANLRPEKVVGVQYQLAGHSDEIRAVWGESRIEIRPLEYERIVSSPPRLEGLSLIDVSGLSKPVIFQSVRHELVTKGRVLVFHMSAKLHYPLPEHLRELFAAENVRDFSLFQQRLSSVLKGEIGPYRDIRLLDEPADPSRSRALLAFASAKHERLMSLLDKREYDYIQIIAPEGDGERARVAQYAAEFVAENYANAHVTRIGTNDLVALLRYLDGEFLKVYLEGGANLEIGLTGSKLQAVASAVLSSRRRVTQAWYLSPAQFDEKRFSQGIGEIRIYDIRTAPSSPE